MFESVYVDKNGRSYRGAEADKMSNLQSQPRYVTGSDDSDVYSPQPYGSTSSANGTFGAGNAYANGGSKGNVLGRTAGSNSTGQVAFTGDSTYMDQSNMLNKAMSDFAAQVAAQKQQATQQYDWNLADSNRMSGVDQYNMLNDFAGRGVLNSGLYAKSEDDRQANVTRQQQQMALGLQNQLSGFNNDLSNFQSENAIALNKAKADAIARQAAKVGIGK